MRSPRYGVLKRGLRAALTFNLADVDAQLVRYESTIEVGELPRRDAVRFVLQEPGASASSRSASPTASAVVQFVIAPVNNQPPRLRLGARPLRVHEGGRVAFWLSAIVYVTDADTPLMNLTYFIERAPLYGTPQRSLASPQATRFSRLCIRCIEYIRFSRRVQYCTFAAGHVL